MQTNNTNFTTQNSSQQQQFNAHALLPPEINTLCKRQLQSQSSECKKTMVETCMNTQISHSSPSCLCPSPATSQTFFPSFLSYILQHSHNTTNPQKSIHPTLLRKKSCYFPTRKRPRIQAQVTSRDLVGGGAPG